jgi:hypothetical protein
MQRAALAVVALPVICVVVGCAGSEHATRSLLSGVQATSPGAGDGEGHPSGDCSTCHGPRRAPQHPSGVCTTCHGLGAEEATERAKATHHG